MRRYFLLLSGLYSLLGTFGSRALAQPFYSVSLQQNSVETTVSGSKIVTTFQVYAPESRSYKIKFWLMGVKHTNGTYSSYDLRIDNGTVSDQVVTDRGDWYLYSPQTSSYCYLTQGTHSISLEGTLNDVPNAEFVQGIYSNYNSQPIISMVQAYQSLKNHVSLESEVSTDSLERFYRKIDCFPYEHNSASPPFYFTAELNKKVYYTFYRKEYYTIGQTVSFVTDVVNGVDHVLNVFNPSNPGNGSWSAASVNGHATLSVTIPQTGFYYVLVRTDSDTDWGTCNLTINNDRRFEDIPVGCSRTEIVLPPSYGQYFSCFAKSKAGNPAIMLIEDGDVVAYNDDFPYDATLSDYDWGKNARIDSPLSEDQWLLTITPTSSTAHNFDIYTGCRKPQTGDGFFPNLKVLDYIQSSQSTLPSPGGIDSISYNCISWAVGEWMVGFWLLGYDGVTPNPIKYKDALESIFNAYRYVETNSETEADIDLWSKLNHFTDSMECTHASIRSKGGYYAAGYDWESKLGHDIRIFHPRYALSGNSYGNVFTHYKRDESWWPHMEEPIFLNVRLTQEEIGCIEYGASQVREQLRQQFDNLYNECRENGSIRVSISIDTYEEIKPYAQLLALCKETPELHYLLYQRICDREILAIKLLMDITKNANKQLLDDVLTQIEEQRLSMQTSERKVLGTVQADALALVKALLSKERKTMPVTLNEKDFSLSNAQLIETSVNGRQLTIGFELAADASVSVMLGSLDGSVMENVVTQRRLSAGRQQISTVVPRSGIYTIGVVINGSIYKKKVTINK